jgi:hypothetical protein
MSVSRIRICRSAANLSFGRHSDIASHCFLSSLRQWEFVRISFDAYTHPTPCVYAGICQNPISDQRAWGTRGALDKKQYLRIAAAFYVAIPLCCCWPGAVIEEAHLGVVGAWLLIAPGGWGSGPCYLGQTSSHAKVGIPFSGGLLPRPKMPTLRTTSMKYSFSFRGDKVGQLAVDKSLAAYSCRRYKTCINLS